MTIYPPRMPNPVQANLASINFYFEFIILTLLQAKSASEMPSICLARRVGLKKRNALCTCQKNERMITQRQKTKKTPQKTFRRRNQPLRLSHCRKWRQEEPWRRRRKQANKRPKSRLLCAKINDYYTATFYLVTLLFLVERQVVLQRSVALVTLRNGNVPKVGNVGNFLPRSVALQNRVATFNYFY